MQQQNKGRFHCLKRCRIPHAGMPGNSSAAVNAAHVFNNLSSGFTLLFLQDVPEPVRRSSFRVWLELCS